MKRFASFMAALGLAIGAIAIAYYTWTQVQPIALPAAKATSSSIQQTATTTANSEQTQKESTQIQQLLQTFAQQYPGQVGVEVVDLDNDASGGVDADDQMVSASLYKIFVAYGIYQKIDAGALTKQSYIAATGESVEACMEAMIEVSDNDCGKALGDMDGWQTLDDKLKLLGLKATMLNNYDQKGNVLGDKQTTPSDIATFMEELYKGLLLSPTSTNDFLNLLKNDQLNDWLPSGLPTGTVIAHKTGALYDLVHDAGIVYSPKGDYLVVLMTKGWNDPVNDAPPVFTGLSSQLWSFFTS